MRLFIGIELPDAVQEALAPLCRAVPGLSPVEPPNLHLTLKFLGEVRRSAAEEVDEILNDLHLPAFELTPTGLGYFKEGGRQISVIWAGLADQPELIRTRNKIEARMADIGFDREPRKYTPHITLARVKSARPARVEQLIVENAQLSVPPFQVSQFSLYESHLTSDGASYDILADYPLIEPL